MTHSQITINKKAQVLLQDWLQLKEVHYSRRAEFIDAVDIEIAKDGTAHLAEYVRIGMLNECTDDEMLFRIRSLEEQLVRFRNLLMMEVLKNGSI